tara:strand:- start:1208 stop:2263 length:1056 start_codon:yes stop_codon:yes gene_type:complete
MTTVLKYSLSLICVATLAIPLSIGEVFAQEEETVEDAAAISTTTEEVTAESKPELWYKSERIFGNIQVGDFVVGPGRTEVEVTPGETVVREITVTNRISDNREFKLELEDITGSTDGSAAVSLTGTKRGPYSIRDYVTYPQEEFRLELGERARIPITISIPPNTEPGGYYGSVLVSTIRPSQRSEEGSAPTSPIIARVGSLFFITVKGDARREGQVLDIKTTNDQWWYEEGPVEFNILTENSGTVHLNPYGEVSITNMFGEEVGFVELEPWFVLPGSLRVRELTWDREFLLGRYKVTARVNRGYDDVVDEVTTSFWVMPWKVVGGIFLVFFIIIFGIRGFFRTFEFKRKGS